MPVKTNNVIDDFNRVDEDRNESSAEGCSGFFVTLNEAKCNEHNKEPVVIVG